jgi:uncharacterized protein (DUF1330 family)
VQTSRRRARGRLPDANVDVTDAATFEKSRKQVPATIAAHAGRLLVRGGRVERVAGTWNPKRLVMPDAVFVEGG